MLSDFLSYVWLLLWGWLGLIAGSLGAAVALYEKSKKKELHPRRYIAILLAFLLIAGFVGWRDERERAAGLTKKVAELEVALQQETRKRTPDIRLTVEDAFAGILVDQDIADESPNDTGLVFYMAARNLGLMPSIVDGYLLRLQVPNVGTVIAENTPLSKGFTLRSALGEAVRMDRSNALYEKTLHPIPSGGMEKGILVFIARNVREYQLYSGATYELAWRDVTGNVRRLNGRLTQTPKGTRIPFIPGIEQEPLPSPSPAR